MILSVQIRRPPPVIDIDAESWRHEEAPSPLDPENAGAKWLKLP
jgi:hypothetical protein